MTLVLRREHPLPIDSVDVATEAGRAWLVDQYRPRPGRIVRSNTIVSADDRITGADGTSSTLGSDADRRVLGVIREHGDVVLVGASTVRAERFGLPKRTPLAILTASGDLAGHRLDTGGDVEVVVLGPHSARAAAADSLADRPPRRGWRFVEATDAQAALDALHALGYDSVVVEAGPAVLGALLEAGRIDEVCITDSPLVVRGAAPHPAPLLRDGGEPRLVLVGDDGSRFSVRTGPAARATR